MPTPLDLTHAKVLVSTPRINLRRAASYTHDRGPLSSTSSRFSFNHLLFASPPPSPGLPQLIPRRSRSSSNARPSRLLRVVLLLSGLAGVVYLALSLLLVGRQHEHRRRPPAAQFEWPTTPNADQTTYAMASQDRLPRFPTPAIVHDQHGDTRWTVSIPPNSHFPLTVNEYVEICAKCRAVASRVEAQRPPGFVMDLAVLGRKKQPATGQQHFIDVHEAEVAGFLTGSVSIGTLLNQQNEENDLVGQPMGGLAGRPVCGRSLTFVLASANTGLGQTLMLLWMAYGLAQREGRAFFIDDTRWAYGRYTDIFATPPLPDCRPPLRHEMLPCPRTARHLLVTVETGGEVFGDEDERAAFDLARGGYEGLFALVADDAARVAERVQQLQAKTLLGQQRVGTIVGMHVRRGDRHPLESQYRDSYLPLNLYADRAHALLEARHPRQTAAGQHALGHSLMLVASDDPTVHDAAELGGVLRAQEYIRLAGSTPSREPRPPSSGAGGIYKFVDEGFGWEGGFYAAMFRNLGLPATATASAAAPEQTLSPDTQRLRSLVGRAYTMDLAVLTGASDVVVCAISATGCRLLAVMMGREAAEVQGRWINVDADYGWWPVEF